MLCTRQSFGLKKDLFVRKFIIIICLILLLPSLIFSSKLFSLGFGTISQFQMNLFSENVVEADVINVHNWATGFELRLKLLGMNIDSHLLIQQGDIIEVSEQGTAIFADDIAQKLSGMIGVGFSTNAAALTTLSFSAGTLVGLNADDKFNIDFWLGDEQNIYQNGNEVEFWENVSLAYRLRFDLNIGNFSLGLHYQVPSNGFSYANAEIDALMPVWSKSKIGASFVTTFF